MENCNEKSPPEGKEPNSKSYSTVLLGQNPTPHERADLIVRRLEQFIREGRNDQGGINFRKWQELAVLEIANAIRDAEKYFRGDDRFVTNGLAIGAASILTIGIWGTVLSADAAPERQIAAIILIIAGCVMFAAIGFWGFWRVDRHYKGIRRQDRIRRVLNFDRQLAKLDRDLDKRIKKLQESLKEMSKGNLSKL